MDRQKEKIGKANERKGKVKRGKDGQGGKRGTPAPHGAIRVTKYHLFCQSFRWQSLALTPLIDSWTVSVRCATLSVLIFAKCPTTVSEVSFKLLLKNNHHHHRGHLIYGMPFYTVSHKNAPLCFWLPGLWHFLSDLYYFCIERNGNEYSMVHLMASWRHNCITSHLMKFYFIRLVLRIIHVEFWR